MAKQIAHPSCILIHYSEIGLKGENRPFFQNALSRQIRQKVPGDAKIELAEQRFIIRGLLSASRSQLIERLKNIFGIARIAQAYELKPDIKTIETFILANGKPLLGKAQTFRITARRADKSFPLTSQQIENVLGKKIVDDFGLKVNLSGPEKEIFVDILPQSAFMYTDTYEGLRGLPVGTSGKTLSLFSGGIDSPVASWLMMKRGCLPSYIHFHAFRSAKELKNSKIENLLKILAEYAGFPAQTYFIPFARFQAAAIAVDARYELLLFRRFMVNTTEKLAVQLGLQALVMGDNLGQVASQTLPYLSLTDRDISLPILRPLISYTKEEIIELAKKIGTYGVSIAQYKDCCSIVAKHPTLSPDFKKLGELEKKIGLEKIIAESLNDMEKEEYLS